jgi:non-ribosomal peptide synthase protein (TIGR01720 family)
VDIISWHIILEDLDAAYRSIRSGMNVALPAKTTSFKGWSEAVVAYAQSGNIRKDGAYWLSQRFEDTPALPVDENGPSTEGSIDLVTHTLSKTETHDLLHQTAAAYGTRFEEVLLTALVQTLAPWTGRRSILIDIEGHGREDIGKGLDVSRTVGWFTSLYPVVLSLADDARPGEALKSIKEQLRRVPHRGLSYGLTTYIGTDAEITATLTARRQPRLLFNYGGRGEEETSTSDLFRPAGNLFSSRASQNGRAHPLEIDALVAGGRLHLTWAYSGHVYRRSTIERLASSFLEALNTIVQHCASPDAGGYTPSDFPDAALSQEELDRFLERLAP